MCFCDQATLGSSSAAGRPRNGLFKPFSAPLVYKALASWCARSSHVRSCAGAVRAAASEELPPRQNAVSHDQREQN